MDANGDPRVHGILVYYPIFGQQESFSGDGMDNYLRDSVSYTKDVEGLSHLYRSHLYRNQRTLDDSTTKRCLLPCTPLAVVKLLEACPNVYDKTKAVGTQLSGKTVTVINRSEIVGRPLAAMLANDGANVYSVDVSTCYLFPAGGGRWTRQDVGVQQCIKSSSVVITGVPTKDYRLDSSCVQPNTVVINVASFKNVDEEALLKIPGVLYVPMVGKVTVAMLERNLMRLFDNFHHPQNKEDNRNSQPWYQSPFFSLYTAVAVTILLGMQIMKTQ
mmetsp:Transcript_346/g.843  ORF Transcript_346/g.843 Transcript_346/m.843 type:complete len:273 (+) Transcript_346:362-1180(+)